MLCLPCVCLNNSTKFGKSVRLLTPLFWEVWEKTSSQLPRVPEQHFSWKLWGHTSKESLFFSSVSCCTNTAFWFSETFIVFWASYCSYTISHLVICSGFTSDGGTQCKLWSTSLRWVSSSYKATFECQSCQPVSTSSKISIQKKTLSHQAESDPKVCILRIISMSPFGENISTLTAASAWRLWQQQNITASIFPLK